MSLWSFQGARGARARQRRTDPFGAGLSKLNSVRNIEVDVILGELNSLTACAIEGFSAYRSQELRIP
jgi:hypothetical protein